MCRTIALVAILILTPAATAVEPIDSFPPAKQGNGELRYINKVPVLVLRGKPAEMGEQFGMLAIRNAPDLTGLHQRFLQDAGQERRYPYIVAAASRLKPNFPEHHLTELQAAAKAAERDESLLLFADTIADLTSGLGCSTIVVEKERSTTGGPLFGRNFDWLPTRGIAEHTLIIVYKGEGKQAFAAVTVAPIAGVISGMNDAGLSVTINEIILRQSKDHAPFNWKGVPLLLAFRRVLEECSTVAEAEKLLRSMERTTSCCLTVCDKNGGVVFEITPANLEVRAPENGVTCCTNHFRTEKLCVDNKCWRYEKLEPLCKPGGVKLGVADVFARLDEVHQGKHTLQSMVFEPAGRVLHLAYGVGPATKLEARKLELGKLFDER
ncbi:MAG TPA: C45 family peptidase [Gemmataceae bacterium]|nr:C45 family peptidase [Gemmataceae bacterium]